MAFGQIAPRLIADLTRDFGLSPKIAAGIVGNLAHESGGFGTLQEVSPLVPGSRGGFGYAQWTGPRRKAFERWSSGHGLDPRSYEANYGFLKHELGNTGEGKVLDRLGRAGSAHEAAKIFSDSFLRPGIPHMASRQKWTDRVLAFAGGDGSGASTADSSTGGGASAAPTGLLSTFGGNEMANGPRGILDTIATGSPLFDLGLGILAASGDQPLGKALAQGAQFAQARAQGRSENEIIRQRLLERQQQRQGIQQLQGLLSDPNFDPSSPQALGILTAIAPDAVASGLVSQAFGSERALPADIRTMQELGIPTTPEGFQQFQSFKGGGASEEIDNFIKLETAKKLVREREAAERTEEQEFDEAAGTLNKTYKNLRELSDIIDTLEGTPLEPGSVGVESWRRGVASGVAEVGRIFGQGGEDTAGLVDALDRGTKLANDFIVELITNMPGTTTNQRQDLLQSATVGMGATPNANRLIIADLIERTIEGAERTGLAFPDREKAEELVRELRDKARPQPVPAPDGSNLIDDPSRADENRSELSDTGAPPPAFQQRFSDMSRGSLSRVWQSLSEEAREYYRSLGQ